MKGWLLAIAVAHLLDAGSTQAALRHPGLHEGNPWMPTQPAAIWAVQSAGAAAEIGGLFVFAKQHPRGAKWLAVGLTALEGAVMVNNLKHLKGASR